MACDSSTARRRLRTRVRIPGALRHTHTHVYICRYVFRDASSPPTPLLRLVWGSIAHLSPSWCWHLISHEPGVSSASPRWARQGLSAAAGISISSSVPEALEPPRPWLPSFAPVLTSYTPVWWEPSRFTPGEQPAGFNPLFIARGQEMVTPRCS